MAEKIFVNRLSNKNRSSLTFEANVWVILVTLSYFIAQGCDDEGVNNEENVGKSEAREYNNKPKSGLSIQDPLFNNKTSTIAEWITSEWYECETEESACGLPCPQDDLWVAINDKDFRKSSVCSACMAVDGPLGSVIVEVIENCAGACKDGEIELSRTAFQSIAQLEEGKARVSWQLVTCQREGPIAFSYERDSDEWWAGIQVRNPTLPVAKLEICYGASDWIELERDGWNHFPVSGDLGDGPFDFRITAIDGQQLIEKNIPYKPGTTVQGSLQFDK